MKFKLSEEKYYFPKEIHSETGGRKVIAYYRYPTNNCQLASIGAVNYMLQQSTKEEIKEIFKLIIDTGASLLLVDVHQGYLQRLDEIIPADAYLVKSEYKSPTGSIMILCIIELSKVI